MWDVRGLTLHRHVSMMSRETGFVYVCFVFSPPTQTRNIINVWSVLSPPTQMGQASWMHGSVLSPPNQIGQITRNRLRVCFEHFQQQHKTAVIKKDLTTSMLTCRFSSEMYYFTDPYGRCLVYFEEYHPGVC